MEPLFAQQLQQLLYTGTLTSTTRAQLEAAGGTAYLALHYRQHRLPPPNMESLQSYVASFSYLYCCLANPDSIDMALRSPRANTVHALVVLQDAEGLRRLAHDYDIGEVAYVDTYIELLQHKQELELLLALENYVDFNLYSRLAEDTALLCARADRGADYFRLISYLTEIPSQAFLVELLSLEAIYLRQLRLHFEARKPEVNLKMATMLICLKTPPLPEPHFECLLSELRRGQTVAARSFLRNVTDPGRLQAVVTALLQSWGSQELGGYLSQCLVSEIIYRQRSPCNLRLLLDLDLHSPPLTLAYHAFQADSTAAVEYLQGRYPQLESAVDFEAPPTAALLRYLPASRALFAQWLPLLQRLVTEALGDHSHLGDHTTARASFEGGHLCDHTTARASFEGGHLCNHTTARASFEGGHLSLQSLTLLEQLDPQVRMSLLCWLAPCSRQRFMSLSMATAKAVVEAVSTYATRPEASLILIGLGLQVPMSPGESRLKWALRSCVAYQPAMHLNYLLNQLGLRLLSYWELLVYLCCLYARPDSLAVCLQWRPLHGLTQISHLDSLKKLAISCARTDIVDCIAQLEHALQLWDLP